MSDVFDGYWRHPCPFETGVAEIDVDGDDIGDLAFCFAPHGFFDEDEGVSPELN
jgi:hypothetical protein